MFHPAQSYRVIPCISPTYSAATTGHYISMKNVTNGWAVVNFTLNTTNVLTVSLFQASAVAGTGAKAISNGVMYWYANATSSDDTLTQESTTPATSFSFSTSTGEKVVIFQLDAGMFDTAGATPFDCVTIQAGGTSSSDFLSAHYILQMRYGESDTPSVLSN
jgi:hypothetical protein